MTVLAQFGHVAFARLRAGIEVDWRPQHIFVPMTNWGAGRTTRLVSSHADRLGARIPSGFPTLGSAIRLTDDSATIGRNGSHRLPR